MRFLSAWREQVYAAMRILVGLLFAQHGFQKLFGWFGGVPGEMPDAMVYAAGAIELVGGLAIAAGLYTRYAAFVCSGTMAVAYFMVHQPMGLLPIENRGELAAIYCWVFLLIAATGDGIWSLGRSRG